MGRWKVPRSDLRPLSATEVHRGRSLALVKFTFNCPNARRRPICWCSPGRSGTPPGVSQERRKGAAIPGIVFDCFLKKHDGIESVRLELPTEMIPILKHRSRGT